MPRYFVGALLALIAVGSLLPGTLRIPSPFLTTTEHLLAYAFATFVIVATVNRTWLRILAVPSMAILACVFEMIQIIVPGRRGDWDDVVFGIRGWPMAGQPLGMVTAQKPVSSNR